MLILSCEVVEVESDHTVHVAVRREEDKERNKAIEYMRGFIAALFTQLCGFLEGRVRSIRAWRIQSHVARCLCSTYAKVCEAPRHHRFDVWPLVWALICLFLIWGGFKVWALIPRCYMMGI